MRQVWIDAGNTPNGPLLRAHGIDTILFDAHDSATTRDLLDAWRKRYKVGVYRSQDWTHSIAPAFAALCSADVTRLGGDNAQLYVHANIELHDPAWLVAFLQSYRAIRPNRTTWLVIEGIQGGWFTPTLRAFVNGDAHLEVLAEAYTGTMQPMAEDEVRSNLVNYGIVRAKSGVMYAGERCGAFWDGCAFTQGRLTA